MRSYSQIANAFRQAKKTDELIEMLEQTDIRRLGRGSYMMIMLRNLMNDDSMRGRIMGLFRKAWEAFPQERANLLSYVSRDEFWQMPEMYDYALQGLIPRQRPPSPPTSSGDTFRPHRSPTAATARVNSMVTRLLDMAAGQNKLDEPSGRVDRGPSRGCRPGAGHALKRAHRPPHRPATRAGPADPRPAQGVRR